VKPLVRRQALEELAAASQSMARELGALTGSGRGASVIGSTTGVSDRDRDEEEVPALVRHAERVQTAFADRLDLE